MEKIPSNTSENEKNVYSSKIGDFETLKLEELKGEDVKEGDRVMITTSSGNRYMLRRSESSDGKVRIYNEAAGDLESGRHGYVLRIPPESDGLIAKVGNKLHIGIEVGDNVQPWVSTKVSDIEIRVGLDAAIKEYTKEHHKSSVMGNLGESLKSYAEGKLTEEDLDNI
ncbi:MAG TPA: hypothetical protein VI752_00590 [Candidatus Paceibacterota bacterium]